MLHQIISAVSALFWAVMQRNPLRCITAQKSADLIYFAAEAWNDVDIFAVLNL